MTEPDDGLLQVAAQLRARLLAAEIVPSEAGEVAVGIGGWVVWIEPSRAFPRHVAAWRLRVVRLDSGGKVAADTFLDPPPTTELELARAIRDLRVRAETLALPRGATEGRG